MVTYILNIYYMHMYHICIHYIDFTRTLNRCIEVGERIHIYFIHTQNMLNI